MMANIKHNWQKEIEDLHDFFELWLAGKIAKTKEVYGRFSNAVDDSFSLVGPDGKDLPGATLLPALYQAHGKRKDLEIWTENKKLLFQNNEILVVSYEEWQKEQDKEKGRISTAVFTIDSLRKNGVLWLRVHETWL